MIPFFILILQETPLISSLYRKVAEFLFNFVIFSEESNYILIAMHYIKIDKKNSYRKTQSMKFTKQTNWGEGEHLLTEEVVEERVNVLVRRWNK